MTEPVSNKAGRPDAKVSPRRIRLEATTHCQLKCPTCVTATGELYQTMARGFLRFDNFKRFIDENPQLREIELSKFGEIFLNPHLPRIIEYAFEKNVQLSATNGVNLNTVRESTLEALVKYRFYHMRCSIDGASQETYEQYRVRGNFDQVIENIDKINAYKKQYQSEFPLMTWQFVVFGHNEHEIGKARQMAHDRGMEFETKLNWDENWSPVRDKDMVRKEMGIGAASRSEFKEKFGSSYTQFICHQLWDQPNFNFDGSVWGCCHNYWKAFDGNVFEDGLEGAVNSEQMQYARRMLTEDIEPRADVPCASCSIYKNMRRQGRTLDRLKIVSQRKGSAVPGST
ncbi:MAG: SPASM domain-containing protein [Gammaproteobacteria bacterium]|nr:MAG: SPASM domain-containing protein [Gammaproteobacteria bacterium]